MESFGVLDQIQVTKAVYERLKDRYHFKKRGLVHIKGKGEMPVYLLTGLKKSIPQQRQAYPAEWSWKEQTQSQSSILRVA
jgi:hypothetical protein